MEDDTVLPIFFDDHIRPLDPNIVDPIDVRDFPARLPMAQVYQVHCVPTRALHSICELTYFWDEVQRCEQAKVAQLLRRRKVASMLHDAAAIRRVIRMLHSEGPRIPSLSRQNSKNTDGPLGFKPWREMEMVKHATPFIGIS